MLSSRALLVLSVAVAIAACSAEVAAPPSSPGAGGNSGASVGAKAGSAGSQAGFPAAGVGAAGGSAGLPGGSAGGAVADGGEAAGGAASLEADATLLPTLDNDVTGAARFVANGAQVDLTITLTGCHVGAHAVHLHANADCADNGNAAGGHWPTRGEGLGDVTCNADGSGSFSFAAPAGLWSIGAPATTDLLLHALVLHAGPSSEPGARVACGIAGIVP